MKTSTLQKSSLTIVPSLHRDILPVKKTAKRPGKKVRIHGGKAYLGSNESACCLYVCNSGQHIVETKRSAAHPTASGAKVVQQRSMMAMHKIIGQPHEKMTRDAAKATDIEPAGERLIWDGCEKVHGRTVAKSVKTLAAVKLGHGLWI